MKFYQCFHLKTFLFLFSECCFLRVNHTLHTWSENRNLFAITLLSAIIRGSFSLRSNKTPPVSSEEFDRANSRYLESHPMEIPRNYRVSNRVKVDNAIYGTPYRRSFASTNYNALGYLCGRYSNRFLACRGKLVSHQSLQLIFLGRRELIKIVTCE